jgi:hypothetical protein
MKPINKILDIGLVPIGNKRRVRMFIHIKTQFKGTNSEYLSFSGVIGPLKSGNAIGGCGQIDMEFAHRNSKDNDTQYSQPISAREIKFEPDWSHVKWLDLLDMWKQWHLKKKIPDEIIEQMNALPDSKRKPAWI